MQLGQGFVERRFVLEGYAQAVVFLYNFTNAHLLAAQFAADIAGIAFKGFLQSGFHVHLHGEVYAAAQIKAEEHRVGTEFGHPFRAVGHQIERGDVAVAQGLLDYVAGFDLCFGVVETDSQRVIGKNGTVVADAGLLQCGEQTGFGFIVDADGLAVG